MHWESMLLPDSCFPAGQHLTSDKLSSSNLESHYGELSGCLNIVRHAGTRVCLYFPQEERAPKCNGIKPGALVVTGNFGKDNHREAAHTFSKIFWTL